MFFIVEGNSLWSPLNPSLDLIILVSSVIALCQEVFPWRMTDKMELIFKVHVRDTATSN